MEPSISNSHPAAAEFACPMHPEVEGHEGDSCPKCGMKLEKVATGKISMSFSSDPEQIEAGKPVRLILKPQRDSGNPAPQLDELHERKVHLIVVREDLSWLDHIHPQPEQDGATR